MVGASASELPARARVAVLLVRDEALRETLSTIIGELSRVLVIATDTVDAARDALCDVPGALLIVAPAWRDVAVERLLSELPSTATPAVVVSATPEHETLACGEAVFVHAPFDVDTLLDAVEVALGDMRYSCTQRVAR